MICILCDLEVLALNPKRSDSNWLVNRLLINSIGRDKKINRDYRSVHVAWISSYTRWTSKLPSQMVISAKKSMCINLKDSMILIILIMSISFAKLFMVSNKLLAHGMMISLFIFPIRRIQIRRSKQDIVHQARWCGYNSHWNIRWWHYFLLSITNTNQRIRRLHDIWIYYEFIRWFTLWSWSTNSVE